MVYEMVAMLTKLLEFGLLSKEDTLENLQRILPFIKYVLYNK